MKNFWIHCSVWAVFILYEMSYVSLTAVKLSSFGDYALHYLVNIGLFYFNVAGFKYIYQSKANRFIGITALVIFELSAYLFIQYGLILLFNSLHIQGGWKAFSSGIRLLIHIYRAFYFIGFSIGYWFALLSHEQKKINLELENLSLKREKETVDMENKLIHAQNAYLQSQLNPHLLFNTLNFIYNSVRKVSDAGAKAILILSDMMRYSLSDIGSEGKVPLVKEIDHLKNLVTLNQLRFNERVNVEFTLNGSFNNEKIIPLVLISFIENIYKHGDLTDPLTPAKINISSKGNVLQMKIHNKKNKSPHNESWGIGVANARARLKSYYENRFELEINENDNFYTLFLVIQL